MLQCSKFLKRFLVYTTENFLPPNSTVTEKLIFYSFQERLRKEAHLATIELNTAKLDLVNVDIVRNC